MNNNVTSKKILISHCKEIVKDSGLKYLSIRNLSEKSGVSIGAIYNYFESKEQLITETIGEIWNELFHFSKESYDQTSFTECLSALVDSVQEGKKTYPFFFSSDALTLSINYSTVNNHLDYNYWSHIKSELGVILSKDKKISPDTFDENLTIEMFVDYIFVLLLQTIMNKIEKESLIKFVSNSIY